MVDIEKLKKHILAGNPTKYNEQEHVDLLISIFSNGEGIAAFCAEAFITKKTFFNWLEVHPKFKEAYNVANNIAERKWIALPLEEGKEINHQYWYIIMKNRFGYGKPRVKAVEDTTPAGRINAIWKAVEEGELTPDEISKIASLAVAQANIKANEVVNQASTIRETPEELNEKIRAMQEIINYAKTQECRNG